MDKSLRQADDGTIHILMPGKLETALCGKPGCYLLSFHTSREHVCKECKDQERSIQIAEAPNEYNA